MKTKAKTLISLFSLVLFLTSGSVLFAQIQFELMSSTPFEAVHESSVAFADIDGDLDLDLVITGRNSGSSHISRLYINDSSANFTWDTTAGLAGASNSSVAFADVDGDNDLDLMISGQNSGSPLTFISNLYFNNGSGVFTLVPGTPFTSVQNCAIGFSDVDGNATPDLVITGNSGGDNYVAELYNSDSLGNYSGPNNLFGNGVRYSTVTFVDVDADQDEDVILTGLEYQDPNSVHSTRLFINDGSGGFSLASGIPFPNVAFGSVAHADVDGDQDEDIFISGGSSGSGKASELFLNDGSGLFSASINSFTGVDKSSVAFSDVDLDGDPDLIITGESAMEGRIAKLYENDGLGNYTEVIGLPFIGVGNGSVAFADVNADTLPDLLITGEDAGGSKVANLYINSTVLSITDANAVDSINFYPNPVNEVIKIKNSNTVAIESLEIFNIRGQLVIATTENFDDEINVSQLETAMYFLRIRTKIGQKTVKFIKE